MTKDELAGEPGALATRPDVEEDSTPVEPVFKPRDFRLNLEARLSGTAAEPLTDIDSPGIRKLTWETVVPDRPQTASEAVTSEPAGTAAPSPAAAAATPDPLPPPRRVTPPAPPRPADPLEPPVVSAPAPVPDVVEPVAEAGGDEPGAAESSPDPTPDPTPEVAVVAPVAVAVATASEENRLALIPDLVEDDSPIELPPITPSGSIIVPSPSVYAPVLAESYYVAPIRPVASPTSTLAVMVAEGRSQQVTPKKKQKRHLFRSFVTLVVLFGLLAGGAYAAKTYLLREPQWSAEMKPLADAVASARGLHFKEAVEVTSLPAADYAKRLAGSVAGISADRAATWRALGLLSGEFDLEAIGRQAMNDSPAFYDPVAKTIVYSEDLAVYEHLYRFAMHRALTMALLDQQYDWSTRISATSPAAALGLRAVVDGDALQVANSLAAADGPDQLAPEMLSFVQGHGATVSPSQYASAVVGRAGVALRYLVTSTSTDPAALAALEQRTPVDDSQFDAARTQTPSAAAPATQGMIFWYYVLASRIDDTVAWSAATRWTGDSVATSTGAAAQCVDAKIRAADPDGAAVLLATFQTWAAAAPAESTTTVVPIDGNQVAIRACDPTAAITATIPARVPLGFGGAAVERALVQAAVTAAAGTTIDPACLVNAARGRGGVLTSPADDAPSIAVAWDPPYVAANMDLGPGCVVTTP